MYKDADKCTYREHANVILENMDNCKMVHYTDSCSKLNDLYSLQGVGETREQELFGNLIKLINNCVLK